MGEPAQPVLHFAAALLPEGWRKDVRIGIAGGLIASVTPDSAPSHGDERHAIGLPGMPNLHSHAFQRAMAGLAEYSLGGADDFWTWREAMYAVALAVSPDDMEAIAAQLYVEMLEAGFTRVGEFHYLHHDRDGTPYAEPAEMANRVLAAAAATGIGMTLLPVFYAHGDFGGVPPTEGQRRFFSDLDGFAAIFEPSRRAVSNLPGANIGIAPHSLRAVAPTELDALLEMHSAGPVHMHVAEQQKEVEACLAWSGLRPVEWLVRHADIGPSWCLIHATHMTEAESEAVAASGAVAGLCPITEANLGDGIFSGRRYLDRQGRFGIGTDSNVLVDPASELRQLEYSQRLAHRTRNVMHDSGRSTGRTLFDRAAAGGAQALGLPVSGLAAGAPADIVSLDASHVALDGREGDRLLDGWIFVAGKAAVDRVWTRGVPQVTGGAHRRRDEIRARFDGVMRRLLARPF